MEIFIATASILAITGAMWLFSQILSFKICPICAGVASTWLWIIIGLYSGLLEADSWKLIAATAMGGSVVGIAYQAEKKLEKGTLLLFKILFIPTGFIAVYGALTEWWELFLPIIVALVLIVFSFFFPTVPSSRRNSETAEGLEEKMKNCC